MSAETQKKIAIYGKGGIGKSVVATNLSACYGIQGRRVLHIGCDPKHDSSIRLSDHPGDIKTVLEILGDHPAIQSAGKIINEGRHNIHLIEAGGPIAGLGCAGRGVARTLETLEDLEILDSDLYDRVIFDVLGDVVCGGFASPLRQGFAELLYIVVSEEPMALFAANNIAKAVVTYQQNGVYLGGLIANLRSNDEANIGFIRHFAHQLNTQVVEIIPRSSLIQKAEHTLQTVVEHAPDSDVSGTFRRLASAIEKTDTATLSTPIPLTENDFFSFVHRNGHEN